LTVKASVVATVGTTPAFAKDAADAAQTIRLPVSLSASLIAVSLALSVAAGGLASTSWPEGWQQ